MGSTFIGYIAEVVICGEVSDTRGACFLYIKIWTLGFLLPLERDLRLFITLNCFVQSVGLQAMNEVGRLVPLLFSVVAKGAQS